MLRVVLYLLTLPSLLAGQSVWFSHAHDGADAASAVRHAERPHVHRHAQGHHGLHSHSHAHRPAPAIAASDHETAGTSIAGLAVHDSDAVYLAIEPTIGVTRHDVVERETRAMVFSARVVSDAELDIPHGVSRTSTSPAQHGDASACAIFARTQKLLI